MCRPFIVTKVAVDPIPDRMGLLDLLKFGRFGKQSSGPLKLHPLVRRDIDPLLTWSREEKLGDGTFGEVFRATQRESGQLAAIKQISIDSEEELAESMSEVSVLAKCSHPNIIRLMEAFLFCGKLWLCLEFCQFGALDSIMLELDRGLSEMQIKFACRGLTDALTYLHGNGIIHRDVKAGNVLLSADAAVKLADFGVSAVGDSPAIKRGTFVGSQYWMAPEVMVCETLDTNLYDTRADVWSLGVTLIELAQMLPPHHNLQPQRVAIRVIKGDPPRLQKPNLWSTEFNGFLSRCLVKSPEMRAPSTELLGHAFISGVREPDRRALRNLVAELCAPPEVEIIEPGPETVTPANLAAEGGVSAATASVSAVVGAVSEEPLSSPPLSPTLLLLPPPPEFATPEAPGDPAADFLAQELLQELLNDVLTDESCDPSVPATVLAAMEDEMQAITDFNFTQVQLSSTNSAMVSGGSVVGGGETVAGLKDADTVTITKKRIFTDDSGNKIVTTTMRTVRKGDENKLHDQLLTRRAELREQRQRGRAINKAEAQLEAAQAAERDRQAARWAVESARMHRDFEAAKQRHELDAGAARTPVVERRATLRALEASWRSRRAESDERQLAELRDLRLRHLDELWRLRHQLAEERRQLEAAELLRRQAEQRDALTTQQAEERRAWPRIIREQRANRASAFKDSLRLPMPNKPMTSDDALLQRRLQREFETTEAERTRQALTDLEEKAARELAEFNRRVSRQAEEAERAALARSRQMKERKADLAQDIEAVWRRELGELRDRVALQDAQALIEDKL